MRDQSHGWSFDRDAWTLLLGHSWVIGDDRLNELGAQLGSREIADSLQLRDPRRVVLPRREPADRRHHLRTRRAAEGGLRRDPGGLLLAAGRAAATGSRPGCRGCASSRPTARTVSTIGLLVYLDDGGQLPIQYLYGEGSSQVEQSTDLWGVFIHDDWRVTDTLTLGLGLRYDLDVGGNNPDFRHPLVSDSRGVDTDNLQPRVTFAWDLSGKGQPWCAAASGFSRAGRGASPASMS